MENQLRVFAKTDTGLSQKVINLRKDIQRSREELKQLQIEKIKLSDKNEQIVELLKNCESMERRRHDVALETEKTLMDAKQTIKSLQKEILFINSNRKDLELAVHGLQEHNGMLTREINSIRD
jgi:chromosome segregation ATPase